MDVRQLNALMMILEGDLDSMALPSQFLSLVLESGDVLLIGGEDLVSSFYLCLLEDGWPEHFVFEKPVEGLDFGLPAGPHRIGACVLPMGFSGATGCLQSWHRTIATEAAEDPQTHEVREALALDLDAAIALLRTWAKAPTPCGAFTSTTSPTWRSWRCWTPWSSSGRPVLTSSPRGALTSGTAFRGTSTKR